MLAPLLANVIMSLPEELAVVVQMPTLLLFAVREYVFPRVSVTIPEVNIMGPCIVPAATTITSPAVAVKLPVDTVVPVRLFSPADGAATKTTPTGLLLSLTTTVVVAE